MNEIIRVRNLVKSFGKIRALDNVSFEIPGGVAALIGPNSSGKTTFINILLGLVKPDAGEASLFDLDPWKHGHRVREQVSVLHEKPRFSA